MKRIIKIEAKLTGENKKKRVAAYARVSTSAERLKHSLSAQISYYSALIQKNPEWEFVRVYADDGISGTGTAKRTEFQQMINDCTDGKIDLILTKSISRFARNTVDLLEKVRYLKSIGVEVFFEKENISSMSGDGELMLSILASYAQEEVRSISDNIKWRKRKDMQRGKLNAVTSFQIIGYEWKDGTLVIVPEEADIIRRIFGEYISGSSLYKIAKALNADGITTKRGYQWDATAIQRVLKNVIYTGNILHQKYYVVDPITKKRKANNGELPKYFVENTHEAVIDKSDFNFVQELMKTRGNEKPWLKHSPDVDFFRGKIICKKCGQKFWHQVFRKNISYWRHCNYKREDICIRGAINHNNLVRLTEEVCGIGIFAENVFYEMIEAVYVLESDLLEFQLSDGRVITKKFANTGVKDYWTPENKAKLSAVRQDVSYAKNKSVFTCKIKCSVCSCNFRKDKQVGKRSPKGIYYYWRCSVHGENCKAVGLRDDILKEILSDVMGTEHFDEELFLQKVDRIIVREQNKLQLHFKDGRITEALYEHHSVNPDLRWSKERRQSQSKIAKKYNKERGKDG